MPTIIVSTAPMGAVRMTQRSKWVNPAAGRYREHKQAIDFRDADPGELA